MNRSLLSLNALDSLCVSNSSASFGAGGALRVPKTKSCVAQSGLCVEGAAGSGCEVSQNREEGAENLRFPERRTAAARPEPLLRAFLGFAANAGGSTSYAAASQVLGRNVESEMESSCTRAQGSETIAFACSSEVKDELRLRRTLLEHHRKERLLSLLRLTCEPAADAALSEDWHVQREFARKRKREKLLRLLELPLICDEHSTTSPAPPSSTPLAPSPDVPSVSSVSSLPAPSKAPDSVNAEDQSFRMHLFEREFRTMQSLYEELHPPQEAESLGRLLKLLFERDFATVGEDFIEGQREERRLGAEASLLPPTLLASNSERLRGLQSPQTEAPESGFLTRTEAPSSPPPLTRLLETFLENEFRNPEKSCAAWTHRSQSPSSFLRENCRLQQRRLDLLRIEEEALSEELKREQPACMEVLLQRQNQLLTRKLQLQQVLHVLHPPSRKRTLQRQHLEARRTLQQVEVELKDVTKFLSQQTLLQRLLLLREEAAQQEQALPSRDDLIELLTQVVKNQEGTERHCIPNEMGREGTGGEETLETEER